MQQKQFGDNFIVTNAYIKKKNISPSSNSLRFPLKETEEEVINPKLSEGRK
jgi:hypothetical protein